MRTFLAAVAVAVGTVACAPTTREPYSVGSDASGLTHVAVRRLEPVSASLEEAERQIAALVRHAAEHSIPISIAGARHSMGGHTVYPDAVVLDMKPLNHLELLPDGKTLRVGTGARWSEVIPYLDARGRSVAIMQSNNDFSVGGSLSVNCHGWQTSRPPIVDSVRAVRVGTTTIGTS